MSWTQLLVDLEIFLFLTASRPTLEPFQLLYNGGMEVFLHFISKAIKDYTLPLF
jgi:hypothetical protein